MLSTGGLPYASKPTLEDILAAFDGIPEMHRNIYVGRNLGESTQMSDAHKAAIEDGSFRGLWVGDYWTHNGINYRLGDVNYFFRCGNPSFLTNHIIVIPDHKLYNAAMNSTDTTDGGYVGSDMYKNGLNQAKQMIEEAFPGMVLTHKDFLVDGVKDGHASTTKTYDSSIELMNEVMLMGTVIYTPMNNGAVMPELRTHAFSQFALFRLNRELININDNYWLRDVCSPKQFVRKTYDAGILYGNAADTYTGVRPYAIIGVKK